MKIFLAGTGHMAYKEEFQKVIKQYRPFVLESFAYMNNYGITLLPHYGDFLLDSGAFTFRQSVKKEVDWNEYVNRYAKFIVDYDVKKYFELDIDSIVGYDEVKNIRKKLEQLTGRPSIPVWHINRGLKDFEETTKEYPYVSLGGIAGSTKGSKTGKKYESAFPTLIRIAHKNGAKIHGLGYTSKTKLKHYHFDSVDSTAWTMGGRIGCIYHFDNQGKMRQIDHPSGYRINKEKMLDLQIHNLTQWINFQKWAEKNW